MSLARALFQRALLGAAAAWALLTATFAVFTMTEDWALGRQIALAFYAQRTEGDLDPEAFEEIRREYLATRGLDRPYYEQYADWMGNMVTLRWGESFETGEAVFPAVMRATASTGRYVVPALAVAMIVGFAVGLYTALYRGSVHESIVRAGSYFGLGLPAFWVGLVILALVNVRPAFHDQASALTPVGVPFVYGTILPALLVSMALSAAIVSYARAYCRQYASTDLTKLVRAKGGGPLAVAKHVTRNAAIPLVSLVVTETFALLALTVFVIEALFGIDGLGLLLYNAVWARDLPMLLGATLVIVGLGVLSNVAQDLAYAALDPRVDTGTR